MGQVTFCWSMMKQTESQIKYESQVAQVEAQVAHRLSLGHPYFSN